MKMRSREINVFSMSALDLFASAMGAFILVSIVLFPYFPNTGVSAVKLSKLVGELEQAKGALAQEQDEREKAETSKAKAESEVEAAKKALADAEKAKKGAEADAESAKSKAAVAEAEAKAAKGAPKPDPVAPGLKLPSLDLVVMLDTTGSMYKQVEGLKRELNQIVRLFRKLSPSFAMGLVEFKDRCEPGNGIKGLQLTVMTDEAQKHFQRFANSLNVQPNPCNRDAEENLSGAMQAALGMQWRSDAEARMIVAITDNPPYPAEIQSTLAAAQQFSSSASRSRVSTVFIPTRRAKGASFLQQLAKVGNGEFVDGGGSLTASLLLALAGI